MNKIDQLTVEIKEQAQVILEDSEKALKGNKAAARRVRKATLELGNRCGKEYRAISIAKIG